MSMRPKRASVAATHSSADASSATSVRTHSIAPDGARLSAVRFACSSPMSAIMTFAPSARKRRQYAVPIPLPPPVTIATRFSSLIVVSSTAERRSLPRLSCRPDVESMSERDEILERVRRGARRKAAHPGAHPPPALPGGWGAFAAALARAGGEAHGPFPLHALGAALAQLVRQRAEG